MSEHGMSEADPTAGERGCQSRNPQPPHQRCENVVCDGRHRDYPADPGKPETRWTDSATPDASTSASEPLSEDERDDLVTALWGGLAYDDVPAVAERIVAAREAKARADAGEQIAQAIEALDGPMTGENTTSDYIALAARIAREVTS